MIRSLPMVSLSKSVAVLLCFLLLVIPALVGVPCAAAQCEQAQDCCCHGMHMAMDDTTNMDQVTSLQYQLQAAPTSLPSAPECECGAVQQSADFEQLSDIHDLSLFMPLVAMREEVIPVFVHRRNIQISPHLSHCDNTQASLCTFQI